MIIFFVFFFQAEDGIRDVAVTGVQTCALPICNFPDVKENWQLRTEEGRAEVLLTPGVFLRVSENSAIRMIANRLIDTRVDRKSTRLNSSHGYISYAVFCLKKKKKK